MKILHICQYYNDGFGYQENLLPRYQAKLGHEVTVITSDRRSYFAKEKTPKIVGTGEFEDMGTRVIRIPIKGEFKGRFVRFVNLYQALENETPDYILHHGLSAPSLITAARYKKRHPSVFLVADNHADHSNSGRSCLWRFLYYRQYRRRLLAKIIGEIDLFFSMTPGCKHFAERELGVPSEKHSLLYLGADVDRNSFSREWRSTIRQKLGFSEDDIVLITAGKISYRKKTDMIVKALKEIALAKVKLLIVGSIEDEYARALDSVVANDKRIMKLGWVPADELYKYFSSADIGVFPGGQSVLWQQAISCNLPVVLRYWPGTEYLLSEKNGLFLFSDNHLELKQHLEQLVVNPDLRKEITKGAEKLTEDVLSYDVIAKRTIDVVSE